MVWHNVVTLCDVVGRTTVPLSGIILHWESGVFLRHVFEVFTSTNNTCGTMRVFEMYIHCDARHKQQHIGIRRKPHKILFDLWFSYSSSGGKRSSPSTDNRVHDALACADTCSRHFHKYFRTLEYTDNHLLCSVLVASLCFVLCESSTVCYANRS